jgi:hypothetical protein
LTPSSERKIKPTTTKSKKVDIKAGLAAYVAVYPGK